MEGFKIILGGLVKEGWALILAHMLSVNPKERLSFELLRTMFAKMRNDILSKIS